MSGNGPHWFEPLAEHLGDAYLRYSFTYGTANEVEFLWDELGLAAGMRVLDVGCGPGRHALALAERGAVVTGVDVSDRFVRVAAERAAGASAGWTASDGADSEDSRTGDPSSGHAAFVRANAVAMPFAGAFDAAISLCQGAFGLNKTSSDGVVWSPGPDPDAAVLAQIGRALRPGGAFAVSAFSSYFQVRHLEDGDSFDAATGVNHERTELRSPTGETIGADLWTTCYTPRELVLLARSVGLEVGAVYSVTPGGYGSFRPDLDHPEFLVVGRAPQT